MSAAQEPATHPLEAAARIGERAQFPFECVKALQPLQWVTARCCTTQKRCCGGSAPAEAF